MGAIDEEAKIVQNASQKQRDKTLRPHGGRGDRKSRPRVYGYIGKTGDPIQKPDFTKMTTKVPNPRGNWLRN